MATATRPFDAIVVGVGGMGERRPLPPGPAGEILAHLAVDGASTHGTDLFRLARFRSGPPAEATDA